jgi:hypothetical protein
MVKRQKNVNKKSIQTNLFVSSFDLILHYLFNKLYKIQVTQNTGYTKYRLYKIYMVFYFYISLS